MIEFRAWPKIARWNRDVIITEKIDGTNAAVVIEEAPFGAFSNYNGPHKIVSGPFNEQNNWLPEVEYMVGAQSRNRLITPADDNAGFAKWVHENAEKLATILGPGYHFGEWWGSGIQRGYGCVPGERYFSLFNVTRWDPLYDEDTWPESLSIVPVLYEGPLHWAAITMCLGDLQGNGSAAREPFDRPEGIVIYHTAANQMFKVTLENDEAPKTLNDMRTKSAA